MNKLFLGDNQLLIKDIKSWSIDLIITDPPYWQEISFNLNGVDFDYSNITDRNELIEIKNKFKSKKKNVMKNDSKKDFYEYDWDLQFSEWFRVLKDNSYLFVFWNLESHSLWLNKIKTAWFKFKGYIVWDKKSGVGWDLFGSYKWNTELIAYYSKWKPKINKPRDINEKDLGVVKKRIWNVWAMWAMTWSIESTWHQTQKPIQIYKKIIEECSKCNSETIILDPFAWSGTIFKASTILWCKAIWFEIDRYILPQKFKTKDFYSKKINEYKLIIKTTL